MLKFLRGTGLKAPLLHPIDALWDLRLGVHTFGFIPAVGDHASGDWRAHYQPTGYGTTFRILRHLGLSSDDVYVDLGSGLGRTVFVADHLGARRSVGVELDAGMHRGALANLARLRRDSSRIELLERAAESYDFADATVVFLYHPFGAGTLANVVARIDASLDRRARDLRFAYLNPVHAAVLASSRHLVAWDVPAASAPFDCEFEVRFWRSGG